MNQPVILVYSNGLEKKVVDTLLYGIEEEGIPYRLKVTPFTNVVEAAYEAALDSPLQVGIAGMNNTLVLHHKSLQKQQPYQQLPHASVVPSELLRNFGSNAARIVKGIPLKSIELSEVNT